ncbi:unnamed protein product [Urochloa humidicola]
MATIVRTCYLALMCLALLHLLSSTANDECLLVQSLMNTTTFPPHAPILILATDAGWANSSHHHHLPSSRSMSTMTSASRPHCLDISVIMES